MITGTAMTPDLLTLTQWLSPAYPVGAFAYSHGIEAAVQSGRIDCAAALQNWLSDVIEFGSGRSDCVLLRLAYGCSDATALDAINDAGIAYAASSERRLEAAAQGAAFGKTTRAIWGGDGSLIYPVAVGAAARLQALDEDLTATLFLHATVGNLASAAQRLMALGQTEAQGIVAALAPLCQRVAVGTRGATLDDLYGSAFLSDIASMQHETQQPRIFRT